LKGRGEEKIDEGTFASLFPPRAMITFPPSRQPKCSEKNQDKDMSDRERLNYGRSQSSSF
jgi:hypothetical protein